MRRKEFRFTLPVFKGLLLVLALSAGLMLAEAGMRLLDWAPQINRINPGMRKTVYRLSDNPVLGYVFKEGYRDEDDPDFRSSYPFINAHGFRDIERSYAKPEGVKRIILLGDSVVAGAVNIREIDDLISRKLEKMLGEDEVEVLNLAVNGYCTLAEVELLRERGLRYDPDLVILVFCTNDYWNINADFGKATLPRAVESLFVRSHLFRLLSVRFDWFGVRKQLGVQEISGEWVGLIEDEKDRFHAILESDDPDSATLRQHLLSIGDDNVARGLALLRDLSREHGFNVLIGMWPLFDVTGIYQVESSDPEKLLPVPSGERLRVEDLAVENRLSTFRFAPAFIRDYRRRQEEKGADWNQNAMDFYCDGDPMHPNPVASQVAAETIAAFLETHPEFLR